MTVGIYAAVVSMPMVYEDHNWAGELQPERGPLSPWDIPSRSLTMRSFVWNQQIDGLNPRGFHAVNLALHLLVGLLVWRLAGLVTGDSRAAVFAALVMLWHPLNSQAVSYVSARTDLLMTACVLSAVIGLLVCRWIVPFAVLGALVSKESGVAVFALLFWSWIALKGWSWRVMAVALVGLVLVALSAERLWFALNLSDWRSMGEHVAIQATGFWRALALFVVAVGLSIDPDPWSAPVALQWASVAGVAMLAGLAVCMRERLPVLAFGLGWAVLAVSPRFVAVAQGEPIHEHHLYLPMAGLSVLAGWGLSHLRLGELRYA